MKSLWNPQQARKAKDKVELLVYSSRLIGMEPKLCVWGGGNTSTKDNGKDHRGRTIPVLYIKGSGSDLKVSTRRDYPAVSLEDLRAVFHRKAMTDEEMVDYVSRCLLDPKAPRPSIEVLLHAFVDEPDIHHTHADAILSITNTKNNQKIAKKIFGNSLLWIPYVKPGFTLAQRMGRAYRDAPGSKGAILEKHGLITWGPDAKTSYQRTIQMVTLAEQYLQQAARKKKYWSAPVFKTVSSQVKKNWLTHYLPVIRKAVSKNEKTLLYFCDSKPVMDFVNARDAAIVSQVGPATPDHMLRTKRTSLYLQLPKNRLENLNENKLEAQIQGYAGTHERYFQRYKKFLPKTGPVRMLDPYPKVILVPGVGMISSGKDLKAAKIVSEIYEHSISVMVNASRIDAYQSLSEKLAFEMDYWPMELYKLSLAPAEAQFSREIGLVTGAARGIGRAIAEKLVRDGAHVFLSDIDAKGLDQAVEDINAKISGQRAFALVMDVTSPSSVQKGLEEIVLQSGGLDFVVSNAGIAHVSSIEGLRIEDWEKSFAVNATGHFLVSRAAVRIMRRQKMGGALVFIASKNVLAPGRDFGAYSTAKAAQSQLARILAIENGEIGIRVNVVNPDGVFEDSGLWDAIRSNRAKSYGIADGQLEGYYQNRNLMKTRVAPEDVAEATSFLISKKSSKTTGCILTVDGGVKEAFPR